MKIAICSDIHGSIDKLGRLISPLTKEDVMIICCNFGFTVSVNKLNEFIEFMTDKDYPTILVLDSNTDNHSFINTLNMAFVYNHKVKELVYRVYYVDRGDIYTLGNKKFLLIGSSTTIDKKHRSKWSIKEQLTNDEIDKIKHIHEDVDYVITTTCPEDLYKSGTFFKSMSFLYNNCPTRRVLDHILKNGIKFNTWYFGYFHIDRSSLYKNNTYISLYDKAYIIDGD